MMTPGRQSSWFSVVLGAAVLMACAQKPPTRLEAYVGTAPPGGQAPSQSLAALLDAPVGFLAINDSSAPDAAPPLPEVMVNEIANKTLRNVSRTFPLSIHRLTPHGTLTPSRDPAAILELARENNVDYVLVFILSSTETRTPVTLTPVAGSYSAPGTELQNFAVAELAMIDARTGSVLIRADGRDRAALAGMAPLRTRHVGARGGANGLAPKGDDPVLEMRFSAADGAAQRALIDFQHQWHRLTVAQ